MHCVYVLMNSRSMKCLETQVFAEGSILAKRTSDERFLLVVGLPLCRTNHDWVLLGIAIHHCASSRERLNGCGRVFEGLRANEFIEKGEKDRCSMLATASRRHCSASFRFVGRRTMENFYWAWERSDNGEALSYGNIHVYVIL